MGSTIYVLVGIALVNTVTEKILKMLGYEEVGEIINKTGEVVIGGGTLVLIIKLMINLSKLLVFTE